jgi:hypothetical protein
VSDDDPCGLCPACRRGGVHCENKGFPGGDRDGGMADYLVRSAHAAVELPEGALPAHVAALAMPDSPRTTPPARPRPCSLRRRARSSSGWAAWATSGGNACRP